MEGQAASAQAVNALPAPMIYRALAGVIADVGAVAKDKVNKMQGFKFRSIDDVYNALHPALAKNKVVIVPEIVDRTCEVIGKTKNGVDMIKEQIAIAKRKAGIGDYEPGTILQRFEVVRHE